MSTGSMRVRHVRAVRRGSAFVVAGSLVAERMAARDGNRLIDGRRGSFVRHLAYAEISAWAGARAVVVDRPWAATESSNRKVPVMTTMITRPSRRLAGRARKTFLVLHILSSAAWFGIDLALGILVVAALVATDPRTAGMAVQAGELVAIWPMFAASLICLVTGVVLGIGSKYGLVRFWWVAVKLGLNILMSTLIITSLRSGIGAAATIGARLMAGDTTVSLPSDLLFPVVVAPSMLLTAYVLSVFKPWGRIRRRTQTI